MGGITHAWHRGAAIIGFFITVGMWLLVAFALRPRRRSNLDNTNNIPMRDLELGDPYREHERERNCERSLADTDDNDIFGNPWNNNPWRVSEDSLEAPKPISRSLSPGRRLTDPDMVDIPLDDWPLQVPPPVEQRSITVGGLLGLGGRMLRWKAQAADRKGKGKEPEMARELPVVPEAIPDVVVQPLAASTAARSDVPYPLWLVGRKASDGPRNARFEELDVDHPTVTPPDDNFLAIQLDLISRAPISVRPGLNRNYTWHGTADQDCGEGPSRPVIPRHQTSHL